MSSGAHSNDLNELYYDSDSSESSLDLDVPSNVSLAAHANFVPGTTLSDRLRLAASNGLTDKCRQLISLGAHFTADKEGRTALHYAAICGHVDTVQYLIFAGFNFDARDQMGYTPLHRAAAQGHADIVGLLIQFKCMVDTVDNVYTNSPLHEAAWNGFSKVLELLISSGANVQAVNSAGFSALHMAVQNGHNQCTRLLLQGGCNPHHKNNYGDTAFHTAARYGHSGVARILIGARCNVNHVNKNLDTALHISSALKRLKISKLLLVNGVDIMLKNKQNETAAEIAIRKGHMDIYNLILSHKIPNIESSKALRKSSEVKSGKKSRNPFLFKRKKSKENEPPSNMPPLPPPINVNHILAKDLVDGFRAHQAKKRQNEQPIEQPICNSCHCMKGYQNQCNNQIYLGNGNQVIRCHCNLGAGYHSNNIPYDSQCKMINYQPMVHNYYMDLAGNVKMDPLTKRTQALPYVHLMPLNPPPNFMTSLQQAPYQLDQIYGSQFVHPGPSVITGYKGHTKNNVVPSTAGRIYRSRSDESLSTASNYMIDQMDNQRKQLSKYISSRKQNRRENNESIRRRNPSNSKSKAKSRKGDISDGSDGFKSESRRIQGPEGRSDDGQEIREEFTGQKMVIIPNSVKEWFKRNEGGIGGDLKQPQVPETSVEYYEL